MLLSNPLVLALAISTLLSGGAVVGYQMMDPGDPNPCGTMEGMDHMGGGMMASHDDTMDHDDNMAADHDAMMADMDGMHDQCQEMMENHRGENATGDHAHGSPGAHSG